MATLELTSLDSSDHRKQDGGRISSVYDTAPLTETTMIRLLDFVRPPENSTSPSTSINICCKLYTADLATSPSYIALSYMWGEDPATKSILINDYTFCVRQNLWDFLNRAKDAAPPHSGSFWIDAICINQENLLERGHQVALMGGIYSNARLVASWLGADDAEHAPGIDYMPDLYHMRSTDPDLIRSRPDQAKVEALSKMCNHEYWTRTWIVQEVVLPHDAEIWIGSRKLQHKPLTEILIWLSRWPERFKIRPEVTSAAPILIWRAFQHQYAHEARIKLAHDAYNLFTLLRTTRSRKCKDVRDRVFALIGLMPAQQRAELNIVPDYTKSTVELCGIIEEKMQRVYGGNKPWWYAQGHFSDLLRDTLEIGFGDAAVVS